MIQTVSNRVPQHAEVLEVSLNKALPLKKPRAAYVDITSFALTFQQDYLTPVGGAGREKDNHHVRCGCFISGVFRRAGIIITPKC